MNCQENKTILEANQRELVVLVVIQLVLIVE